MQPMYTYLRTMGQVLQILPVDSQAGTLQMDHIVHSYLKVL